MNGQESLSRRGNHWAEFWWWFAGWGEKHSKWWEPTVPRHCSFLKCCSDHGHQCSKSHRWLFAQWRQFGFIYRMCLPVLKGDDICFRTNFGNVLLKNLLDCTPSLLRLPSLPRSNSIRFWQIPKFHFLGPLYHFPISFLKLTMIKPKHNAKNIPILKKLQTLNKLLCTFMILIIRLG